MSLGKGDVLLIVATKIILPTMDIITDIIAIHTVLTFIDPEYEPGYEHVDKLYSYFYLIGYLMIFFFILSFLTTIPAYWRVEKSKTQKLIALPFLLLCSWPQYRGLRLLWWAYVGNTDKLSYENILFEQDLSHIGELYILKF